MSGDAGKLVNTDQLDEITNLAEKAPEDLAGWLEMTEKLRQELAVNINRKVATDALFMSMAG